MQVCNLDRKNKLSFNSLFTFFWAQADLSLSVKKTPLPHQIVNTISKKIDSSINYEQVIQSEEFPVRPGQPDCDYFMKTGDCKYRAACRYNHPVSRDSKLRLPPLSSKGLCSKSVRLLYHFLLWCLNFRDFVALIFYLCFVYLVLS